MRHAKFQRLFFWLNIHPHHLRLIHLLTGIIHIKKTRSSFPSHASNEFLRLFPIRGDCKRKTQSSIDQMYAVLHSKLEFGNRFVVFFSSSSALASLSSHAQKMVVNLLFASNDMFITFSPFLAAHFRNIVFFVVFASENRFVPPKRMLYLFKFMTHLMTFRCISFETHTNEKKKQNYYSFRYISNEIHSRIMNSSNWINFFDRFWNFIHILSVLIHKTITHASSNMSFY